jgi:hypothetical protein
MSVPVEGNGMSVPVEGNGMSVPVDGNSEQLVLLTLSMFLFRLNKTI